MEGQLKVRPASRPSSRPASPAKQLHPPIPDTQPFRPKARVNAVAQAKKPSSTLSARSPVAKNINVANAAPRARSKSPARSTASATSTPTKPRATVSTAPRAYAFVDNAKAMDVQPKARSALGITRAKSLRPSNSVPTSPDGALSSSPRDPVLVNRQRNGSLLRHSSSQYQLHAVSSSTDAPPSPTTSSPPVVIRARVSDVTLNGNHYTPTDSLPPSPSLPPLSLHRRRTPSVSSSFSANSLSHDNSTYYPITTPTPAANPHRYSTVKSSPPPARQLQAQYRPFPAFTALDNDSPSHHRRTGSFDRLKISPTLSPPTSTLSYSSQSSTSRASSSYRDDDGDNRRLKPPRSSLSRTNSERSTDDYFSGSDAEVETARMSEDERGGAERAEAKSNRKMADLEIINRSLTATNSSLEATKHRQAKEIRELRRKLRESRLILPPRTYQSLDLNDEIVDDQADDDSSGTESDLVRGDETYQRVRLLLDNLLETCKQALESRPADFGTGGGTKVTVLSAEEVRNWRGDATAHEDDENNNYSRTISPARVAIPDSNTPSSSEDDDDSYEEMSQFSPPIRITTSSVE